MRWLFNIAIFLFLFLTMIGVMEKQDYTTSPTMELEESVALQKHGHDLVLSPAGFLFSHHSSVLLPPNSYGEVLGAKCKLSKNEKHKYKQLTFNLLISYFYTFPNDAKVLRYFSSVSHRAIDYYVYALGKILI